MTGRFTWPHIGNECVLLGFSGLQRHIIIFGTAVLPGYGETEETLTSHSLLLQSSVEDTVGRTWNHGISK